MTATTNTAHEIPTINGLVIRRIQMEAPWDWLNAGWRDLWVHPMVSFTYGALFAIFAVVIFLGISFAGAQSIILALAGGFLLVGPAIAVGVYEVSRRIERGEATGFWSSLTTGASAPGQLSFFGAVLAFFYFVWLETALLLFMLFMGSSGTFPPASQFIPTLLFEPHGLALLVVGTFVGAILATTVFAMSVVSVPLLLTTRIDTVSAIYISLESVRLNPRALALWAALIAAVIAVGFVTCFVGLIVAFPLVGHASWHAFRDIVRLEDNDTSAVT